MKLLLISPEEARADETQVVRELFLRGLERYHLRKPSWAIDRVRTWLEALPPTARRKVILHQHHELASEFELGGVHFPDRADRSDASLPVGIVSKACHDLSRLDRDVQEFDSVLLSPVFPSISKPGYGGENVLDQALLRTKLTETDRLGRRADVFALGGINFSNTRICAELGFDGVAVLGALWCAANPVTAFLELQNAVRSASAGAHALTLQRDRLASR